MGNDPLNRESEVEVEIKEDEDTQLFPVEGGISGTKKWLLRLLAVVVGTGIPYASYIAFKYDRLLRLAMKFPGWLLKHFTHMPSWVLGVIISSFPVFLAILAGTSLIWAWKLWRWEERKRMAWAATPEAIAKKRAYRSLVFCFAIPVYSVVLVLRASGNYFHDGLVPMWVDHSFDINLLKKGLPWVLTFIFTASCALAWFSRWLMQRRLIKAAGANVEYDEKSDTFLTGDAGAPETLSKKLLILVVVTNVLLLIGTFVFIKLYGRRVVG